MIRFVLEVLGRTPFYVYLILSYLIYVGVKASKTQVVHINRFIIISSILFIISIKGVQPYLALDNRIQYVWLSSIIGALVIGWLFVFRSNIEVDSKKNLLKIPGNWSTLFIALSIFSIKYFFGFKISTDKEIMRDINFIIIMVGVSNLPTGIFIGRFLNYLYRLKTSKSVNLVRPNKGPFGL